MPARSTSLICSLAVLIAPASEAAVLEAVSVKHHHHGDHHHKKHHGKHHHHHNKTVTGNQTIAMAASKTQAVAKEETQAEMVAKMKTLEKQLEGKMPATAKTVCTGTPAFGHLHLNAPLPADFDERFMQAAAKATECSPQSVLVTSKKSLDGSENVMDVTISGPVQLVHMLEDQAADPRSVLTSGPMRPFLVVGESVGEYNDYVKENRVNPPLPGSFVAQEADVACKGESCPPAEEEESESAEAPAAAETCPPPCAGQNIDIDTEMPYGELEPFGREDTAQELTESSITESDEMVDQLERAEVAEEKRAVFRALTRLRGAAITSFDGVARSQTGNIDEYNKVHKWRTTHPLRHLADEESDITRWAFPDNADF